MVKQKVSVSKLQKFLSGKSSEELRTLIIDISSFDEVQSYFYMRVHPENIRRASEKYKKIIKEEFYPENRNKQLLNYDVIKKCVKDFQATCPVKSEVACLMLYVVELGSEFSKDFDGIDEEFYEVIEGVCENVFIYITLENTIEESLLRTYQPMFGKDKNDVLRDISSGVDIKGKIKEKLKMCNSTIIMKYFPAMSISTLDIMGVLDDAIAERDAYLVEHPELQAFQDTLDAKLQAAKEI